jgi:hypothetical protein
MRLLEGSLVAENNLLSSQTMILQSDNERLNIDLSKLGGKLISYSFPDTGFMRLDATEGRITFASIHKHNKVISLYIA